MSNKIDINELLILENELKLMKIISDAVVNNRISFKEHYNCIVRDTLFPQINSDILEELDLSPIWKFARYIVDNKDIRKLISTTKIVRGTGSGSKTIDRKKFLQEIIKSFDLNENEEIADCLNRIVKLLEILIRQNMYIEIDMFANKCPKKDTIINNSKIISYESNIKPIIKSKK